MAYKKADQIIMAIRVIARLLMAMTSNQNPAARAAQKNPCFSKLFSSGVTPLSPPHYAPESSKLTHYPRVEVKS